MDIISETIKYATNPTNGFLKQLWVYMQLSGTALLIAALVGAPLGIIVSRYRWLERASLSVAGFLRVVPPIVALFMLLPWLGIGFAPSVVALTLLAIPPLLINTDVGLRGVNPAIIEAGTGMGMSSRQLLWKVQLPLAMPVMVAGLRLASVEVIASAVLATLIGGGGLGDFISSGLTLLRPEILLTGAVPAALLALGAELALAGVQRRLER